jgi:uncharacterized membrane protein YidH (DUF202 family)
MFSNLIEKANAAGLSGTPISAETLLQRILDNIVNPIVLLMISVAVLVFMWGVFEFIRNAESSEERKKGGMHMLFGAIGLFIMVTAYGILNLILGTIGKGV